MMDCPPPLDRVESATFSPPAGATDCHAHVVSSNGTAALVPGRSYTPPAAPEPDYLRMLDATGMSRGVLIQISVYGTDNTYLLDVLSRHPDRLRGVAVADSTVTNGQLEVMSHAGVVALRLNVLFGGGVGFSDLEVLAGKAADLGWHLELLMDVKDLPDLVPRLRKLPVPIVIDHMGHNRPSDPAGDAGRTELLRLLEGGDTWVKISGAYRIDEHAPDYPHAAAFAKALLQKAPDRAVYGSDWPHVAVPYGMPDTGHLRNLLAEWAGDEGTLHKVLVTNPESLYHFPPDHDFAKQGGIASNTSEGGTR
jgi:2-pyrone-4,6-dicarboxylate lactonase